MHSVLEVFSTFSQQFVLFAARNFVSLSVAQSLASHSAQESAFSFASSEPPRPGSPASPTAPFVERDLRLHRLTELWHRFRSLLHDKEVEFQAEIARCVILAARLRLTSRV